MISYNDTNYKIFSKSQVYHNLLDYGKFDFLFFNAQYFELFHVILNRINEFDSNIEIIDVFNNEIIFDSIINNMAIEGKKQYNSILDEFDAPMYYTSKQTINAIIDKLDNKLVRLKDPDKLIKYSDLKDIIINTFPELLI